nr:LCP family protein [uncultured Anaeromusa sp.]
MSKLWIVIVAVLLLVVSAGAACLALFNEKDQPIAKVLTPLKGKVNILVLGVDEREDDVGRSDTSFVVTIDNDAKKATMLSIPRDSRVKIAGHGWDKVNHAFAFGGAPLSKTTIENLLGIPIDYTVSVNFRGFMRMVDAVGGITVDVDKRMRYSDPYDDDGGLEIDLYPGVQKLNGRTAIEYVRYRDEEGDIGRVARQQKFLKALFQEMASPQMISKLPELIKEFSSTVKTDMPTAKMLQLLPTINDALKAGLETEWVTGTPIWIQDVSYWLPDITELRSKVAHIQGIAMDERYRRETENLANEYKQSVPREIRVASPPAVVQRGPASERQTGFESKNSSSTSKAKNVSSEKTTTGSKNTSATSAGKTEPR